MISEKDAATQIGSILDDLRKYIDRCIKVSSLDISGYIQTEYHDIYQKQIEIIVPELMAHDDLCERLWLLICEYFHLSIEKESKNATGLLLAGYGAKDAFPKVLHIEIHKLFKEGIKYTEEKRFIGNGKNAEIIPVAQREVIYTFCRGISSRFIESIPKKVNGLIESQIDSLPTSDFSDEQKTRLKTELSKCGKKINDTIWTEIQSDNVQPIIDSVKLIALPEMAFLAENLVNITTLKRTYSLDGKQQTVGGPTDVAVLSKARGFMWVKKKHVFSQAVE